MRRVLFGVLVLCAATGLALARPAPPTGGAATPGASPRPATPVPVSDADVLATRIAGLEATVAAQSAALLELDLRVDELEQGLAPVLEGLPEQAVVTAFLQNQIDDLRARVATLEEVPPATPTGAAGHPLVGTWAVADAASGGAPGLVTFTPDGTVVVVAPGGGSGVGAWAATGPRTAVAAWVLAAPAGPAGANVAAVRAEVEVDGTGTAIEVVYRVLEIGPRGGVAEQGDGTVRGARVPLDAATPLP